MKNIIFAEYIWVDGTQPRNYIRSKGRVLKLDKKETTLGAFPDWSFDGSSTNQATGGDSDSILKPVNFVLDPYRESGFLVLCEVFNSDAKTAHSTNARAKLKKILETGIDKLDPYVGFEQEYTLFKHRVPLGWPDHGFPAPQGPYYCGVGARQIFGRDLAEEHAQACVDAGIMIYGINAEVMPGQWEFQIGYRGFEDDNPTALNVCDHLVFARWLIHRISEAYDYHVSLNSKPIEGAWNGAGMHTNFSTNTMRKKGGYKYIEDAISKLAKKHKEHIAIYGHNLHKRLTGKFETANIGDFSSGVADRGSSIRIPRLAKQKGYGYLEDRRPGADADPYLIVSRLCMTIFDIDDSFANLEEGVVLNDI